MMVSMLKLFVNIVLCLQVQYYIAVRCAGVSGAFKEPVDQVVHLVGIK